MGRGVSAEVTTSGVAVMALSDTSCMVGLSASPTTGVSPLPPKHNTAILRTHSTRPRRCGATRHDVPSTGPAGPGRCVLWAKRRRDYYCCLTLATRTSTPSPTQPALLDVAAGETPCLAIIPPRPASRSPIRRSSPPLPKPRRPISTLSRTTTIEAAVATTLAQDLLMAVCLPH